MKRFAIPVILLYVFSLVCQGQVTDGFDRNQIHAATIQNLLETDESFDALKTHYTNVYQIAKQIDDEHVQAECLFQLARIDYWQTQYSSSLAKAKEGLLIAKKTDDHELLIIGYELVARLYYLYSPEHAQYYYQKCWELCEKSDSMNLIIAHLNNYNMIRNNREVSANDLVLIDLDSLKPLPRARLSYIIARSMTAEDRVDEATEYLENTRRYLQEHNGTSPLNAMCAYQMARIYLLRGDLKKAWKYLADNYEITTRNKQLFLLVEHYLLASEVAQAENRENIALKYLKKGTALRDSIFYATTNQHFFDQLANTMMEYQAEDEVQTRKKRFLLMYILLSTGVILATVLAYYSKSIKYRKKTFTMISNIKESPLNGFPAQLKNHLMKITYEYKAGLQHSMIRKTNISSINGDVQLINHSELRKKYEYNADQLMDALLKWIESGSNGFPQTIVDFDAKEIIEQVVDLYRIISASKSITYRLSTDKTLPTKGDKIMLAISLEYLFAQIIKPASKNTTIAASAMRTINGLTVSISDPWQKEYTLEKEIFIQRTKKLGLTTHVMLTPDKDFNVFAACTVKNRAKINIEYNPETGTIYHFSIPTISGQNE